MTNNTDRLPEIKARRKNKNIATLLDIVKRQQEQLAAAEEVIEAAALLKPYRGYVPRPKGCDCVSCNFHNALAAYRKQYPEKDDAQM